MRSVVEVKDLVKVYQRKDQKNEVIANAGLTFSVFEGEYVGILGPNGSGKTTFLLRIPIKTICYHFFKVLLFLKLSKKICSPIALRLVIVFLLKMI